ncbi:MAG: aldo/keto reductase [Polyangiaceae bacterium]|nr:aldo/keto reductase [Polyangiaceae bacterium]
MGETTQAAGAARQRSFGATGLCVPAIGLGTWAMERDEPARTREAVARAVELGLCHVDTAEMYGDGAVETLLGEALAGRRDAVFLASKVVPEHASYAGTLRACEASLRRLRTDRLDLYLLHWPGVEPLADTFRAFERLQADGKIRAWGVSNFCERDLAAALDVAGEGRIACNQVLYHLEERSIEHAVVPFCRAHRIAVVGYSPFGSGAFPAATSPGGRALAALGAARGLTPRQIALAFLVREPDLFAIPKAARPEHVSDNAGALGVVLGPDELAALEARFPRGPRRRGVPTA